MEHLRAAVPLDSNEVEWLQSASRSSESSFPAADQGMGHLADWLKMLEDNFGSVVLCDCGQPDPASAQLVAQLANEILTAEVDVLVWLTGVGTRSILEMAFRSVSKQRLIDCLIDMTTIAGSVGAANALREYGIEPTIDVAQVAGALAGETVGPNWRDVLISIDCTSAVSNQRLAIESTPAIHSLRAGLESRGAHVTEVFPFAKRKESADDHEALSVETVETVETSDSVELDLTAASQIAAQLHERNYQLYLFSDPGSTWRFLQALKEKIPTSGPHSVARMLAEPMIVSLAADATDVLTSHGIEVDLTLDITDRQHSPNHLKQLKTLQTQKRTNRMNLSGPATSPADPQAPWFNSPFMKACRGEPTEVTPIWMMRQAGRYMAEYRAVRDKVSFLDLCANPQLCSEVMCTAVKRLGVDAAIIFSDLLPILVPMGCDLEFVKGDGPVIHNPIREASDIDRIKPLESNAPLQFVMDTVTQTRNDLPADIPLIGFAGAPFTLASYMIEGGASRNYANTKKLMFGDRGAWDQLMNHLADSISMYLLGQVEAGAQCLQIFDSWAGCLAYEDYREYVHPYVKRIIASIPVSVPVINFATGNPALLPLLADTQASVVGIDWRTRLDDAWKTVGFDRAVQGNLDPTVLLTNPQEIRRQAKVVLDQAAGRAGHIFNLGHGILPMTPVDNAIALVDAVHELSQR